ncbi:cytochrome-c peroxidase [Edaphobacter modestus]|uniref:cytochrome-c peroxidase n=1 Tax=Edaphobacter modestus TaxID=388466 RepID=UPI0013EECA64|nr:cytochrome c peroxidase [Edaphobacter modestus]
MLPGGANEDPDVATAVAFINLTESNLLQQVAQASSLDLYHQITLLGAVEIYDVNLSPLGNIACATCHVPYTGFRGSSSVFNATTSAQAGGIAVTNATPPAPNYRFGPRNPQSYAYAAFAPILHYNETQGSFYGGNFWDMRATGIKLDNPAAEQAQGPPVNPVEMGNIDTACVVWKASQRPYASLIMQIWGAQSFAIQWPGNVATICATPGPPPANDPLPVHLSAVDRGTSNSTYDHMTMAMASYEASADVSPFASKFDAYLAGNADLSAKERNGYNLFNGKAGCNQCHLSGTAADSPINLAAADVAPLFTDFTANNIGLPKNLALPYYCEDKPDQYGYTANPLGLAFLDLGVGAMLSSSTLNPNPLQWKQLAPLFNGTFQTATVRNVDKRPRPDFVKEYMHNGYLKSLKEVVHFYNTSQVLPRCEQGSKGEKVTCWPEPEYPATLNTTQLGNLGLSSDEEDDVVAFLKTLTDGFVTSPGLNKAPAPPRRRR